MDAVPDARLRGDLAGAMDRVCADHDANGHLDERHTSPSAAPRHLPTRFVGRYP